MLLNLVHCPHWKLKSHVALSNCMHFILQMQWCIWCCLHRLWLYFGCYDTLHVLASQDSLCWELETVILDETIHQLKKQFFLIKCFNYTLVIFISSSENKDSCELQYVWCHSLVCYLSVKLTKYKTLIRKQNTKQTVWRQAKLVTEGGILA